MQAALQKNRYPMNVDGAIAAILADLGMKQAGFNGIFMIPHARVDRACYRRTSPRETRCAASIQSITATTGRPRDL